MMNKLSFLVKNIDYIRSNYYITEFEDSFRLFDENIGYFTSLSKEERDVFENFIKTPVHINDKNLIDKLYDLFKVNFKSYDSFAYDDKEHIPKTTVNHIEQYKKKFSIGYNGRQRFVNDIIEPCHYYLSSVYTTPPLSMGGTSARTPTDAPIEQMLRLRNQLKEYDVDFNLVFNADGIENLNRDYPDYILFLCNLFEPDIITVSNTYLLEILLRYTEYQINLSVIMDIKSIDMLDMLLAKHGQERITSYNIARSKVYDVKFIKEIRARYPILHLKLLVNEGCLHNCPDQNFHSCTLSYSRKLSGPNRSNIKTFFCSRLSHKEHWRFLTGQYIPPKFLSKYINIVDEFKIGSRKYSSERIAQILKEYIYSKDITIRDAMLNSHGGALFCANYLREKTDFKDRSDLSNLYNYAYPEDYFDVRSNCEHNCFECGYCKGIL